MLIQRAMIALTAAATAPVTAQVLIEGNYVVNQDFDVILREFDEPGGNIINEITETFRLTGTAKTLAVWDELPEPGIDFPQPEVLSVVVEEAALDFEGEFVVDFGGFTITLSDFGLRLGNGVGTLGDSEVLFNSFPKNAFFVQSENFGEYVGNLSATDGVDVFDFPLGIFGPIDFDIAGDYGVTFDDDTPSQFLRILPFALNDFEFDGRTFQIDLDIFAEINGTGDFVVVPAPGVPAVFALGLAAAVRRRR